MAEARDVRMEEALRALLRTEAATLPLTVSREEVIRRAAVHRATRSRRLRLVLLAALLMLPLAVAAGMLAPAPTQAPAYRAVIVQGLQTTADGSGVSDLEIMLAGPDGHVGSEVVVPASRFAGWRDPNDTALSPSGRWLALGVYGALAAGAATALVDLEAPDADVRILSGPGLVGWGPDDTLWRAPNGPLEHIDPLSGSVVSTAFPEASDMAPWPWPTWGLPVAADGSGAMLLDPSSVGLVDGVSGLRWAVLGDDGVVRPGTGAPDVAPAVGPRISSADAGILEVCDSAPSSLSHCTDVPTGTVIAVRPGGASTRTVRGAPPPDEFVLGSSWAADGGAWLLVDRRDAGRTLGLVRVRPDGTESRGPVFAASPTGSVGIAGLAPDDSLVAVGWAEEAGWQTVLVDPVSGRSVLHQGQLAGFVGPRVTDHWGSRPISGADGVVMPAAPEPGVPGYPPLMSLEDQVAQSLGPSRVLLVHEEPATSSEPGERHQVVLGPVALDQGYELSLVCSGPGDVTFESNASDGDPVINHCQSQGPYGEGAPNQTAGTITVTVTADTSSAWRMVVLDPPPEDPRLRGWALAAPVPSGPP